MSGEEDTVPNVNAIEERNPKNDSPREVKSGIAGESDAPASPSDGHAGKETIDIVLNDDAAGITRSLPAERIDEESEHSPGIVPSPGLGEMRFTKSGRKNSALRHPTPMPGELAAIVKSPAYLIDDGSGAPIPLLAVRSASIGNATAAQLHAPTPATPIKFTLGRVFDDTSKFDDLPMLDAPNSWRIAGIAVWGGKVVNGIRITYERGGMLKSSRELVGHDDGPHEWEQIELRPGEEIVKVEAVISYRIEKLTFRTSQSRHGTFGRGTEGDVHELSVPSEHRLVAFHGGVGGSLHTFGFWTLPLPTSFLNRDEPMPGLMLLAPHERPGFIADGGGNGGLDAHIPIEKEEQKGCQCTIQ